MRDAWAEPDRAVDGVFMGFWLSHVPRERLDAFLALARRWLKPGGRFAAIDSLPDMASGAADHPEPADDLAVRRLADGREFTIVKVYYRPDELAAALGAAGIRRRSRSATSGRFFVIGSARADLTVPHRRGAAGRPVAILRPMSPLSNATIATVGSGVMAEAMIAGLLRGALVAPERVIASHPDPNGARRWSASTASGPSPTTSRPSATPTSSSSGSSPRC